jgi:hypothetical protein
MRRVVFLASLALLALSAGYLFYEYVRLAEAYIWQALV